MEDKVVNLNQGFAVGEPHPEADYIRAKRPDNAIFDQIVLRVVPEAPHNPMHKWKTFVKLELLKKGKIVFEGSYRDMQTALMCLPAEYVNWSDAGELPYFEKDIAPFCDQQGCVNVATVAYEQINKKCPHCNTPAKEAVKTMRKFCEEHKWRGGNKTDDGMENYKEIK